MENANKAKTANKTNCPTSYTATHACTQGIINIAIGRASMRTIATNVKAKRARGKFTKSDLTSGILCHSVTQSLSVRLTQIGDSAKIKIN